jgi:hypothetical protein
MNIYNYGGGGANRHRSTSIDSSSAIEQFNTAAAATATATANNTATINNTTAGATGGDLARHHHNHNQQQQQQQQQQKQQQQQQQQLSSNSTSKSINAQPGNSNSNIKNNSQNNNVKFSNSDKQSLKSFTVAQLHSQPLPSKYISKIKDLYDKERSSSTESIHQLLSNKPTANGNGVKSKETGARSLDSQRAKLKRGTQIALPELLVDGQESTRSREQDNQEEINDDENSNYNEIDNDDQDDDEDDEQLTNSEVSKAYDNNLLSTSPSRAAHLTAVSHSDLSTPTAPSRSNKYIKHIREALMSSSRSDSLDNLKRNSLLNGQESNASATIDKLKEKFDRMANNMQQQQHQQTQPIRNSLVYPSMGNLSTSGNRYSLMNAPMASTLAEGLSELSLPNRLLQQQQQQQQLNSKVSIDASSLFMHAKKLSGSPRQTHKYQRSKTSDLSDLIFARGDTEQEQQQQEHHQQPHNYKHEVVNKRVRKYEDELYLSGKYDVDAKYQPENAIIRSTWSHANGSASAHKHSQPQSQSNEQHAGRGEVQHVVAKIAGAHGCEASANATTGKRTKTKSILKSPSSVSEKSIHFDEHVDVIQINDDNSTQNSPGSPNLSAPGGVGGLSNSSAVNFQPLFVSERDLIKKMLLEPPRRFNVSNEFLQQQQQQQHQVQQQQPARDSPLKSSLKYGRSRTERIFVKSPTPMREIPSLDNKETPAEALDKQETSEAFALAANNKDASSYNGGGVGGGKNRNRFAKKKAALRSQSVELTRLIDKNPMLLRVEEQPDRLAHVHHSQSLKQTPHKGHKQQQQQQQQQPQPPQIKAIINNYDNMNNEQALAVAGANRPNLTRQNAFTKTKSLGDDIDKLHLHHHHNHHQHHLGHLNQQQLQQLYQHQQQQQQQQQASPEKHHRHHKHHHRHHHHHHRHKHRNRTSGGGGGGGRGAEGTSKSPANRKGYYRASSLTPTGSSSSESSYSESFTSGSSSSASSSPSHSDVNSNSYNNYIGGGGSSKSPKKKVTNASSTVNKKPYVDKSKAALNAHQQAHGHSRSVDVDKKKLIMQQKINNESSDDSVCGIPKPTPR